MNVHSAYKEWITRKKKKKKEEKIGMGMKWRDIDRLIARRRCQKKKIQV